MGLLSLLTSPLTAPVSGVAWVARVVLSEAEREYHDVEKIRQQIADIESQIHHGNIGETEGDELLGQLVERLIEAQQYHAIGDK